MAQTYPAITNYSGRQVDVELLQSISKPSIDPQRVNLAVVTQPPKIVAGMEKLAQRYALILLTNLGSVHFDQEFGSEMLTTLAGGNVQSKGSLLTLFGISNITVVSTIKAEDEKTAIYGTMPLDEQLQSAELLDADVDVSTGTVYLKVGLTTKAGTDMVFIIPTTTPR